jgi:hypothetical protein
MCQPAPLTFSLSQWQRWQKVGRHTPVQMHADKGGRCPAASAPANLYNLLPPLSACVSHCSRSGASGSSGAAALGSAVCSSHASCRPPSEPAGA